MKQLTDKELLELKDLTLWEFVGRMIFILGLLWLHPALLLVLIGFMICVGEAADD